MAKLQPVFNFVTLYQDAHAMRTEQTRISIIQKYCHIYDIHLPKTKNWMPKMYKTNDL